MTYHDMAMIMNVVLLYVGQNLIVGVWPVFFFYQDYAQPDAEWFEVSVCQNVDIVEINVRGRNTFVKLFGFEDDFIPK